ncbi:MAG: ATP-binding protein [Terriglobales bacterium]
MFGPKFRPDDLFVGGGQMGAAMCSYDWSKSTLGTVDQWPHSLRVAIRILLGSSYPIYIAWGREYTQFYNDSYLPILGIKHPDALGKGTPHTFAEIWDFIGPMFDRALEKGEATGATDQILFLERNGYPEECYFTFSYSPIPGDDPDAVGGVFVTALETTDRVIEERRLTLLRDLASRCAEARTEEDVFRAAATTLASDLHDMPFSLVYTHDRATGRMNLAGSAGIAADHPLAAQSLSLDSADPWPISQLVNSRAAVQFCLAPGSLVPPAGPWSVASHEAMLVPITLPTQELPVGCVVAGLNPHKRLDASYRTFIDRVVRQVASGVADARAFEEERRRSEQLAALDRAKTTFFSNISHELRTPLTLLLAPIEDALQTNGPGSTVPRDQLELVHRNGLRLLKLVNTLLDFSRIEAGRIQASYRQTDVTAVTADLASTFRAAIEKAGLTFQLDFDNITSPVFLDRQMWEKIVLNLLSNAFKYTLQGSITMKLREVGQELELTVADTGCGIPDSEIPRIFERFHRVESTQGRTHEGTGIGLSLVQELVRLHGGTVTAQSEVGRGTTLHVRIPLGSAHLPADRINTAAATPARVEPLAFLQQSMRPAADIDESMEVEPEVAPASAGPHPRILLADDNADLRSYIKRILSPSYDVVEVGDGQAALDEVQRQCPDLILSDIMMPRLDGFELLKRLRSNPETESLPVILLSARAGEESRIEGLEAGADDYLIKPFTSRELLARVGAHIAMQTVRREATAREAALRAEAELQRHRMHQFFMQAPAGIAVLLGPEHRWAFMNPMYERLVGRSHESLLGKTIRETLPELATQGFFELLDNVYRTGKPYLGSEMKCVLNRATAGAPEEAYFNFIYEPVTDASGKSDSIFVLAIDVTEQVTARKAVESSAERLRLAQESAQLATWEWNLTTGAVQWAEGSARVYGRPDNEISTIEQCSAYVFDEDRQSTHDRLNAAIVEHTEYDHEFRVVWPDGSLHWLGGRGRAIYEASGNPVRVIGINWDVTDRKHAEQVLRRTEQLAAAGRLAATVAHEINNPLEAVTNLLFLVQGGIGNLPPDHLRQYLSMADEELRRVSHISRQTLGFYRESSAPVYFQMSELLDEVLALHSRALTHKNINVKRSYPAASEVFAVKGEIRQVLSNLITNAIDASSPNSSLHLRVRTVATDPETSARSMWVTVADRGVGVPRENFRKIFEPFFTTKKSVGTGLGLWVSREIIEKHGGSIRLRSSTDPARRGTVISFSVPLPQAAAERITATA